MLPIDVQPLPVQLGILVSTIALAAAVINLLLGFAILFLTRQQIRVGVAEGSGQDRSLLALVFSDPRLRPLRNRFVSSVWTIGLSLAVLLIIVLLFADRA